MVVMSHFPPPALRPAFWVRRDLKIDWPELGRNARQVTPVTVLSGPSGTGKTQPRPAGRGRRAARPHLHRSATRLRCRPRRDRLFRGEPRHRAPRSRPPRRGVRLLEQVLADHSAAGPDPDALANVQHNLADAYRMTGRAAEARALYRQCIASYDRHQKGGVAALTARGGLAALGR
ncbi:tetratricopeptide repeat protein [Dactylosporangium sp. NPDC050688]|uniref:tetratricopeptide repeat protein n=1 Tax=Dactylosporangium sp. NPDC050688 TaxID=3157217 RepID=UPI0033D948E4